MALKSKKPTNQCLWRVGLGNLKLDYDLSSKSPIARPVRHTTCATSAWTTPDLATIHHINNTLPDFPAAVNRKHGACAYTGFPEQELDSISAYFARRPITNPLQHSPTHRSGPSTPIRKITPTFVCGIFAGRRLFIERIRTAANDTKEKL